MVFIRSRSSLVRPDRSPRSSSAWRTHWRTHWPMPNRRATCVTAPVAIAPLGGRLGDEQDGPFTKLRRIPARDLAGGCCSVMTPFSKRWSLHQTPVPVHSDGSRQARAARAPLDAPGPPRRLSAAGRRGHLTARSVGRTSAGLRVELQLDGCPVVGWTTGTTAHTPSRKSRSSCAQRSGISK